MITLEKLEIFLKYSKDIDYFGFSGSKSDKNKISDEEWSMIDDLVMSIGLINKGQASDQYIKEINEELAICCDGLETINKLKEIVNEEDISQINPMKAKPVSSIKTWWLNFLQRF